MMKSVVRLLLACSLLTLCSCSKQEGPARKETSPVKGEVYVDGKPAGGLQVTLTAQTPDPKNTTVSSTMTGDDGKFAVSTYEQGDGAPEGEYVVTFLWGKLNVMSMSYGGPDKLNGRYTDAKKSTFKIKVEKGKPTEMGKIELTSK